MAVTIPLPRHNRETTRGTVVVTPVPGPSSSARIECTGCPGVMRVSGFPLDVVRRVSALIAQDHSCSANS